MCFSLHTELNRNHDILKCQRSEYNIRNQARLLMYLRIKFASNSNKEYILHQENLRWRISATCEKRKIRDNKSYVGDIITYVGLIITYVGVTNSYLGPTKSYVGLTELPK